MKSYQKKPTTWIYFSLKGEGTEWIDQGLPIPNYLEHTANGYIMGYEINGYFGTKKGIEYLNDIIARVLITFKDLSPERLNNSHTLAPASIRYAHTLSRSYNLKELQALKSLDIKLKPRQNADNFSDYTFWAIKFYCEELIKSFGIADYQRLEEFAINNFEGKEHSTLKAKCRSVWNWYEQRKWEIPKGYKPVNKSKEQIMASRQEHIKKVHENRAIQTKNKIKAILDDIFMQEQIKLKNGKYKISAIAELAGVHRETVSIYLKEMELI